MPVITLSAAATERIAELCEAGGTLVVGVAKGGCAGMEYTFRMEPSPPAGADLVESGNARVAVEPGALLYLLGSSLDWRADAFSARFVFDNPNQLSACGCGESVNLAPCQKT